MVLNTTQAAKRLGLLKPTVCDLAAKGLIEGRKVGVSWTFEEKKIMTFAKKNGVQVKEEQK